MLINHYAMNYAILTIGIKVFVNLSNLTDSVLEDP